MRCCSPAGGHTLPSGGSVSSWAPNWRHTFARSAQAGGPLTFEGFMYAEAPSVIAEAIKPGMGAALLARLVAAHL